MKLLKVIAYITSLKILIIFYHKEISMWLFYTLHFGKHFSVVSCLSFFRSIINILRRKEIKVVGESWEARVKDGTHYLNQLGNDHTLAKVTLDCEPPFASKGTKITIYDHEVGPFFNPKPDAAKGEKNIACL